MNTRIRFFTVVEVLFSIIAVALSMRIMSSNFDMFNYDKPVYCDMEYLVFLYPSICVSNIAGLAYMDKKKKIETAPYIIRSAAFLIMSCVVIVIQDVDTVMTVTGIVYGVSLLLSRIASIIKNHKPSNITLNVWGGLIALLIIASMAIFGSNVIFASLIMGCIAMQSLVRVMSLALSRLRFDLLIDIVRRSMALEILSGLIILIVSFSFALSCIEPDMRNYGDALWYCFAIVTTIGFGDITAVTMLGRILSLILGIYGIIVVSLVTSIIVSFIAENKSDVTNAAHSGNDEKIIDDNKKEETH